ncbi:MAG: sugar ABC transporter ATP-binding protein, partial [Gluconacetobacter diazotrophicus]|nr:sugar ABC transporter ATP-binding protein [Gluconacetobacter diazotrophicus]
MRHISKRFGGVLALDDIHFDVAPGEVHCLAGENGSGKSTLIKIISGVQPPESGGIITVDGTDHASLTPAESIRRGIQVIYQDLSLFPNLSVAENIAIEHQRGIGVVRTRRVRDTAASAMARLGISLDPDGFVADLPIAERQLVAICRAIAQDARLLIMDEPTASLTRREVDALLALTRDLKRARVSVVFVSHRLDEVLEVSDRVTVLRNGRHRGTFPAAGMTDRRLGELMTGRAFDHAVIGVPVPDAPPVLSVSKLSRAGDYHDISFAIRPGEILGLTGRLGSGRTELALSLFGMRRPDSGEIRLRDRPLALRSNREAIAAGIAYLSEDRLSLGLVLPQPISANLAVTTLGRLRNRARLVDADRRSALVRRWIDELGIKIGDPDDPVGTLSGGNQQRVGLAKWLATDPVLLILDSPTVGVDIGAKDGIYRIVRDLAENGLAVLMISDEIPEVFFHCHRVLVMREGRLVAEFDPARATEAAL